MPSTDTSSTLARNAALIAALQPILPRARLVTDPLRRLALGAPLTFRAAGTSLSGQATSDSLLVLIGEGWATGDLAVA